MEKWNYLMPENSNEKFQKDWNQTLISKLNEVNESILNENDIISASYVLKDLLESLSWLNKPIINYRYDIEHSIYVNNNKLRIECYEYNHQKDEEWISAQKNIFLNLDLNPLPEIYPEVWKSKESIRNYLNKKFTSGRIIDDNDIIYEGILTNRITDVGSIIFFHIDELKSKNAIYEYALTNNENESLHPNLTISKLEKDDMIEVRFYNDKPHIVDEFKFYKEDFTVSHPNSFRKFKRIIFGFPVLIDLPINGNVKTDEIYEIIGEALKKDFIKFLKENK
jgi:hypothetical protein